MRGTLSYGDDVLIFGASGIWKIDRQGKEVVDFNMGIRRAAEYRQIRNIAITDSGELYAVAPLALYRFNNGHWIECDFRTADDERMSDVLVKGDSVIAIGRSHIYIDSGDGVFRKVSVKAPNSAMAQATLFRTVWLLHSGEMFGFYGRLLADSIAVILLVLCTTGFIYWIAPKVIKYRKQSGKLSPSMISAMKQSLKIHDRTGKISLVFILFITISGWCLRPPVMIPLAMTTIPAIPGTMLDNGNYWNDKLRMLRFDTDSQEWLLSTSEGFFCMKDLDSIPISIENTPPVSVMGLNVLEKDTEGNWLCGSFSGMYRWNRKAGIAFDYFTNEEAKEQAGPPIGRFAVSGYSKEFNTVAEYYDGTQSVMQPDSLNYLPMSLWNVALEVHSGRIFIGSSATYFFIFFIGLCIIWSIWSGWKVRRRK